MSQNNSMSEIDSYRARPVPLLIQCEVMNYLWGDTSYMPSLLGLNNFENKPYAELYIGAHPKAPAKARIGRVTVNLDELIHSASNEILGKKVASIFNSQLPYLLKVLTVSKTLSLQAHPNKQQAEAGWKREKGNGPNYKDKNHKPEIVCAVTKFWVLNKFRPINEILSELVELDIAELEALIDRFKHAIAVAYEDEVLIASALKELYIGLMDQRLQSVIPAIIERAKKRVSAVLTGEAIGSAQRIIETAEAVGKVDKLKRELWVISLNEQYPQDMGILSVYLLNLIKLEPGEALYLPPGELHAYLGKLNRNRCDEGVCVELMTNSDNVLRGGFTQKHIDVKELSEILSFNSGKPEILRPTSKGYGEHAFITGAPEFELSVITIDQDEAFISRNEHSADMLIVMDGREKMADLSGNTFELDRGKAILVPSDTGKYTIRACESNARIYKASVPFS